jgi:hypothetical protein
LDINQIRGEQSQEVNEEVLTLIRWRLYLLIFNIYKTFSTDLILSYSWGVISKIKV